VGKVEAGVDQGTVEVENQERHQAVRLRLAGFPFTLPGGLDRVRFLSQVKSGKRVRIQTKITAIAEKSPGRLLCTQEKTMEIEGESKPAYVAEALSLFVAKDAK